MAASFGLPAQFGVETPAEGYGVPGRVFITQRIPEPGPTLVRQAADEVVMNPEDRVLSPDELRAGVAGCRRGALLADRPDRRLGPGGGAGVSRLRQHGGRLQQHRRRGGREVGHPGDQHPRRAHRGDGRPDLDPAPGRDAPGRRGGCRDALGAVPRLGAVLHAGGRRHRPDARPDRAGADRAGRGAARPRFRDEDPLSRQAPEPRARRTRRPSGSSSTGSWPRPTSSACTSRSPPRPAT